MAWFSKIVCSSVILPPTCQSFYIWLYICHIQDILQLCSCLLSKFSPLSVWNPEYFFASSTDKFLWYICFIDINTIFQYCRNSSRRSSFNMPGHIKLIKGAVDPDPTGEQNWSTFSLDVTLPQNFCCQVLIWRRTTRTSRTTPRSPSGSTTPRTAATGRVSWRLETSCSRSPLPNALCQLVIIYKYQTHPFVVWFF